MKKLFEKYSYLEVPREESYFHRNKQDHEQDAKREFLIVGTAEPSKT